MVLGVVEPSIASALISIEAWVSVRGIQVAPPSVEDHTPPKAVPIQTVLPVGSAGSTATALISPVRFSWLLPVPNKLGVGPSSPQLAGKTGASGLAPVGRSVLPSRDTGSSRARWRAACCWARVSGLWPSNCWYTCPALRG